MNSSVPMCLKALALALPRARSKARRAGETIAREELATQLKGGTYDPAVDRSLDVHVSHLRQKLEKDPREPKLIKTIRGIGYVLVRPN